MDQKSKVDVHRQLAIFSNFLRKRGLKLLIALLLIASGIWTLYLVAAHGSHLHHASGQDAASETRDHATMDHSQMHH